MTDLERKIDAAERRIATLIRTPQWEQSVKKSDKQVDETLEKLSLNSQVDPKLLDEPATL